jgi:hypothetical protein
VRPAESQYRLAARVSVPRWLWPALRQLRPIPAGRGPKDWLDRQEPELPMLRLLPKKEEKIVH